MNRVLSISSQKKKSHYVRKAYSRHVYMKNGDVQIVRLRHHVSHYRVIGDARPGASLSIHGRRATSERVTYPYATNPRHVNKAHLLFLINSRHSLS
jgi:hypothetical protein